MPTPDEAPAPSPEIDDFLGEPTRDLEDWRWLWTADVPFPVRSHRGLAGRLIVAVKRLLRPLVRLAAADLWDRQRVWNLVLLDHVAEMRRDIARIDRELQARMGPVEHKTAHLEAFLDQGLRELMRYDDALYARVDQKLDRYRRDAAELEALLGAALDRTGPAPTAAGQGEDASGLEQLAAARADRSYLELERRHRGTAEEIRERLSVYLPLLENRRRVLDLGCGRGEALALFASHGIGATGVDGSAEMVRRCREQGLEARQGDALAELERAAPGSLDAVVSFHVVEHLPAAAVERLARSAWSALEAGGVLILETPNPLSLVVGASSFWRDPTHLRPLHPDALRLCCERAGFERVVVRPLHPFAPAERLPEIELGGLAGDARELALRVNELRDRIDRLLHGEQDYAVIAHKA